MTISIFSKVKNAKKAADHHKRGSSEIHTATKIPPAPYKHTPTHAAQDSLSCTPTIWSIEETRQKIAAAHEKKRNNASKKANHSRSNTELSSTSRMRRTESDLSIDSIIASQKHNIYQQTSPYRYHGPLPPFASGRINHIANSVPITPAAIRRSPLSSISTKVEDESKYTESSKNSTCSTASSRTLELTPPIRTIDKGAPHHTQKSSLDQKLHQATDMTPAENTTHIRNGSASVFPSRKESSNRNTLESAIRQPSPLPAPISTKSSKRHWFGKRR